MGENPLDIVLRVLPEMAPGLAQGRQQFQDAMNAMASSTAPVQAQLKATEQNIKDLAKAIQDNKLQPASAAYQQFAAQLAAAEKQAAALRAQLGQQAQAMKTTEQATTSATGAVIANTDAQGANVAAVRRSIQAHQEMAAGVRVVGDLLTVAVSAPLIAAGAAAVHFSAQFETEMTKVVTLAGATSAEVAGLRESVLKLAPEVGIGPAELAKGLFVLESYGLKGAAAMDTLTIAAKMSALGMGATSETARALTGVLFAYKNQNLSAADAGDILTKTVQLGNMKIGELIPALAKVGPIAAAMGVSFQDVAASVATFTHAGVDASLAATGMRAVLNSILTDSAKTEKGFKALAAAAHDNTISMAAFRQEMTDKGLTAAMLHLMDSVEKAGDAGVKAVGSIIPNIRGLTEALAVYKANGGMVVDILGQLKDAHGTLEKSTAELKKTAEQMWAEIRAEMEVVFIALGDKLLPKIKELTPAVKTFLEGLLDAVDRFSKLSTPVQHFIENVLVLGLVGGPVLSGLSRLAMAWTTIERAILAAKAAEVGFGVPSAGGAAGGAGAVAARSRGLGLLGGLAAGGFALGNSYMTSEIEDFSQADQARIRRRLAGLPEPGDVSLPADPSSYLSYLGPQPGVSPGVDRHPVDPALLRESAIVELTAKEKTAIEQHKKNLEEYADADRGYAQVQAQIGNDLYEAIAADAKRLEGQQNRVGVLADIYKVPPALIQNVIKAEADWTKESDKAYAAFVKAGQQYDKLAEKQEDDAIKARNSINAEMMKEANANAKAFVDSYNNVQKLLRAREEAAQYGVDKEIAAIERRRDAEIHAVEMNKELVGHFKTEEIQLYQDAADKEIAALRAVGQVRVDEVFRKAAMEADRVPPKIDRMTQSTHLLTKALSELGQSIGGSFGALLTGAAQISGLFQAALDARDKYDNAKTAYENGTGTLKAQQDAQYAYGQSKSVAISGGIGIGLGLVAQNIDTSGQASTHGIIAHYAAEGAAAGAPYAVPTYGASIGVGAGVGALYGWYESGKEWRRVAQDLARDFGGIKVSDDFAKAIEDLEDQTGLQRIQALTTQLDKLVEQAGGLRADNLEMFTGKLRDAFVFLQDHSLTLAQTTQILDKNFANFAAASTDSMGRLSDKMKEIIQLDETLGTHSKAIADYLRGQGENALSGFAALMGGYDTKSANWDAVAQHLADAQKAVDDLTAAGKTNGAEWEKAQAALAAAMQDRTAQADQFKGELADLGTIAVSSFAAAVASGKNFVDAILAAHPALSTLAKDLKDLGLDADNPAVAQLLKLDELYSKNQGLVRGIGGLASGSIALANMGLLDPQTFAAEQRTGVHMGQDLYNHALASGINGNVDATTGESNDAWRAALLPMQDWLHTAQQQAAKMGVELDGEVKNEIEKSKALGLWKDETKSIGERTIDKLDDILQTLKNLPYNDHGDGTPAPGSPPPRDFPPNPPETSPGFATEAYVRRPTLALIGDVPGGEFVLKPATVSAWMNASYGAGAALASQATTSGWWNPRGNNDRVDRGGAVTVHEQGDTYHVSFEIRALDAADLRDAVEKPGGIGDVFIESVARGKRGRDVQLRRAIGPT